MSDNIIFGKTGEDLAASFLKKNNYKIIKRNYRTKIGEVDIIALDKDTVCFIEVKSRSSNKFGSGLDALSKAKQRQISKTALIFLKENNLINRRARFDVLSINYSNQEPKIDLLKNAFELSGDYIY